VTAGQLQLQLDPEGKDSVRELERWAEDHAERTF
jgi:hypothetical protein